MISVIKHYNDPQYDKSVRDIFWCHGQIITKGTMHGLGQAFNNHIICHEKNMVRSACYIQKQLRNSPSNITNKLI